MSRLFGRSAFGRVDPAVARVVVTKQEDVALASCPQAHFNVFELDKVDGHGPVKGRFKRARYNLTSRIGYAMYAKKEQRNGCCPKGFSTRSEKRGPALSP